MIGLVPPVILMRGAGSIGKGVPYIKEIQAGMSAGIFKESFKYPKIDYQKRKYIHHLKIKKQNNWLDKFLRGGY